MIFAWVWLTIINLIYSVSGSATRNTTSTLRSSSAQTTSSFTSETSKSSPSNGLGRYIISGLGAGSSTFIGSSVSVVSSQTSNSSLQPTTAKPTFTKRPFNSINSNSTLRSNDTDLACQASSVSWYLAGESIESNSANYYTQSEVFTTIYAGDISYGTADVYTTAEGFPHAHGNFTVTSTSPFTTASTWSDVYQELNSNVSYPPSPGCTIASSACSSMYRSYRSSLGIAPTAPIPVIYPIPTNSPQCYDPQSAADLSTFNASTLPCDITGYNVQLFYWAPPATAGSNASVTPGAALASTTVYQNVTMTSPSIYLSFDSLQANILVTGHENQYIPVGKQYTNPPLVSINPSELSMLTKTLPGVDMASVVNQIARGGPDYLKYVSLLYLEYFDGGQNNYSAAPVYGANIATPDPMAYYLGGGWGGDGGPPGCQTGFSQPECGTIFDDFYKIQLAVPSEVRNIDPAWATCALPLFGVYDPPRVLTPAAAAAAPTVSQASSADPALPAPPIMTPFPDNTGSPSSYKPFAAHTEDPAIGGLLLPPPAPTSGVAAGDPPSNAPHEDPKPATQGIGGVVASIGQNLPASGSQKSGSGQNSGNDPSFGSGSSYNADPNSGNSDPSGVDQGSDGGQDPGTDQPANAGANTGGSVASVLNGQGTSGQGNSKQGDGNSGGTGADATDPGSPSAGSTNGGSLGQNANTHGGTSDETSNPDSTGSEIPAQESVGQGSDPGLSGYGQTADPANQAQPQAKALGAAAPIATIGGQAVNLAPSFAGIIVAGTTYRPGGSVAEIAGTPVSVGAQGLVVGTGAGAYSLAFSEPGPGDALAAPIATVGGHIFSFGANGDGIQIDGGQLSQGAVTTVAGTQISYGPSGLVIGAGPAASTVPISNVDGADSGGYPSLMPVATIARQVLSADPLDPEEVMLPNGQTISAGGPAATLGGSQISLGPNGKLVIADSTGSETIPLPTQAPAFTETASGAIFTGADGSSIVAIETATDGSSEVVLEEQGSTIATLSVGGTAVTVDGEVVSAGPGGLVINHVGAPQDKASTMLYSAITVTEPGKEDTEATSSVTGASRSGAAATATSSATDGSGEGAQAGATTTPSSASHRLEIRLMSLLTLACVFLTG